MRPRSFLTNCHYVHCIYQCMRRDLNSIIWHGTTCTCLLDVSHSVLHRKKQWVSKLNCSLDRRTLGRNGDAALVEDVAFMEALMRD